MIARRKWLLLKIVVGLSLVLSLLFVVGPADVMDVMRGVQWPYLLLVAFFTPLSLSVTSLRWKILLQPFGIHPKFGEVFRCYWIGMFVGNFLPTSFGGDVSRVALLRKYNLPAQVACSVVLERLLGLSVLVTMAIISLLSNPLVDDLRLALWLVFVVILCGVVFLVLAGKSLDYILPQIDKSNNIICINLLFILVKINKIFKSTYQYRNYKTQIFDGWLLSLLFYLMIILTHAIFLKSLSLNVEMYDIFWAVPLISLVSFLPITFNGLGLAEGAFVFIYSKIGLSTQEAMAFAILVRIMYILCSSIGGLFLLFSNIEKNKLME